MEENLPVEENNSASHPQNKKHLPSVVIVRDWKEYLGESLLIIFSVLLAIILTEVINNINERHHTSEVLKSLREELLENDSMEIVQYAYHLKVLNNIDSALSHPEFSKQFINNGIIHLKAIAPDGVIRNDLNDVAWQSAKQSNIVSKIDLATYSLLTNIYDNQARITNSEQLIGSVLLSRESRTDSDNRITLILMRDNYHAWTVDRAPALLDNYRKAIEILKEY
jgi:hypothetical protein